MSRDNNSIILENNSLKSEIVNLHQKIENIEEQMKQMVETNKKIQNELSQMMQFLVSFASDTSHELHYIKYK